MLSKNRNSYSNRDLQISHFLLGNKEMKHKFGKSTLGQITQNIMNTMFWKWSVLKKKNLEKKVKGKIYEILLQTMFWNPFTKSLKVCFSYPVTSIKVKLKWGLLKCCSTPSNYFYSCEQKLRAVRNSHDQVLGEMEKLNIQLQEEQNKVLQAKNELESRSGHQRKTVEVRLEFFFFFFFFLNILR